MRLFIAVHFSKEVQAVLQEAIASLRRQSPGGNFTRCENLHLTLAFIGETEGIADVRSVMEQAAAKRIGAFPLAIAGHGRFGDLHWVGIEKNDTLSALALDLQDRLREKGFPIERRAFRPHITIARRLTANDVQLYVPRQTMEVGHISLMESLRENGRLIYRERERLSL